MEHKAQYMIREDQESHGSSSVRLDFGTVLLWATRFSSDNANAAAADDVKMA